MNRFLKLAALAAACFFVTALFTGCRNEKQITEDLASVKAASDNVLALEAGEILLYETVSAQRDVEGHAENGVTETYIKFTNDGELQYNLNAYRTMTNTDETLSYDATCEDGKFVHTIDGVVIPEEELARPDIFEHVRVDYTAADVKSIDVIDADPLTVYCVTLGDTYVDTLDTEADGVKSDYTKLVYNYYVNAEGLIQTVMREYTITMTVDGESHEVIMFSQVTIE